MRALHLTLPLVLAACSTPQLSGAWERDFTEPPSQAGTLRLELRADAGLSYLSDTQSKVDAGAPFFGCRSRTRGTGRWSATTSPEGSGTIELVVETTLVRDQCARAEDGLTQMVARDDTFRYRVQDDLLSLAPQTTDAGTTNVTFTYRRVP